MKLLTPCSRRPFVPVDLDAVRTQHLGCRSCTPSIPRAWYARYLKAVAQHYQVQVETAEVRGLARMNDGWEVARLSMSFIRVLSSGLRASSAIPTRVD